MDFFSEVNKTIVFFRRYFRKSKCTHASAYQRTYFLDKPNQYKINWIINCRRVVFLNTPCTHNMPKSRPTTVPPALSSGSNFDTIKKLCMSWNKMSTSFLTIWYYEIYLISAKSLIGQVWIYFMLFSLFDLWFCIEHFFLQILGNEKWHAMAVIVNRWVKSFAHDITNDNFFEHDFLMPFDLRLFTLNLNFAIGRLYDTFWMFCVTGKDHQS